MSLIGNSARLSPRNERLLASLISLLICSGVSENSGLASTLVCSEGDGIAFDSGGSSYSRTFPLKTHTPPVRIARSAQSQRYEPSGMVEVTLGLVMAPVSGL